MWEKHRQDHLDSLREKLRGQGVVGDQVPRWARDLARSLKPYITNGYRGWTAAQHTGLITEVLRLADADRQMRDALRTVMALSGLDTSPVVVFIAGIM